VSAQQRLSEVCLLIASAALVLGSSSCGHHRSYGSGSRQGAQENFIEDPKTPLARGTAAIQSGDAAALAAALDEGLSVDAVLEGGRTLLIEACSWGSVEIVSLLLERGANRDLKDSEGLAAIDYAKDDPRLLALFTPEEELRIREELFDAVRSANLSELTRLLREVEVDPDFLDSDGDSPLIAAIRLGSYAMVRSFLQSERTDVNFRGADGKSPLGWARQLGHAKIESVLLQKGAQE
jgi:ankyrin repeat protein